MLLTTLVMLLLVSCGTAMAKDIDTGPAIVEGGKFPNVQDRYLIHDDSNLNNDRRQKRAFPPFFQAWKALLKTTFGFRLIGKDGLLRAKVFVKVGTKDTAIADFHSLVPKGVSKLSDGSLTGFNRKHANMIMLHPSPDDLQLIVWDLNNPKFGLKVIDYVDSQAEAIGRLRAIMEDGLIQRYLHK